jgi:hypothetical protein
MVFRYYGLSTVRQCKMASWLFGYKCCAAPSCTLCNCGAWPAQIVSVYNNWKLKCTYTPSQFTFDLLKFEIKHQRPLEPTFFWTNGKSHVVVVKAYYDDIDQTTYVNDPWFGHGPVKFSALVTAYGMGTWALTFSNLRK